MSNTIVTALKDEYVEGWTLIHNDDGSTILTKDGEHYFQVTPDGCSCGHRMCVHQKLVYPTNAPVKPAKTVKLPKSPAQPEESEEIPEIRELPTNTFMLGLFVVMSAFSIVFRVIGWFFTTIGDLLDIRIKD